MARVCGRVDGNTHAIELAGVHTHTTAIHTDTRAHRHTRTHEHTHMHTHEHTHERTNEHTRAHTCTHTSTHTRAHTCTHTHTHEHAHTHKHAHEHAQLARRSLTKSAMKWVFAWRSSSPRRNSAPMLDGWKPSTALAQTGNATRARARARVHAGAAHVHWRQHGSPRPCNSPCTTRGALHSACTRCAAATTHRPSLQKWRRGRFSGQRAWGAAAAPARRRWPRLHASPHDTRENTGGGRTHMLRARTRASCRAAGGKHYNHMSTRQRVCEGVGSGRWRWRWRH